MPGLDGFGFLQRLRDARRYAAHHRADGLRQHRNGGADGARTGRLLVPREAHPAGSAGSADPPRRQPRRAAGGEAQPGTATQLQRLAGRTGGHFAQDAGDFCPAAAGRTEQGLRADHRRERHRQGTGGAHGARAQPAAAGAVCRHQLRGAAGNADRKRAVRPRKRFLHGRFGAAARAASRWRSTARCCSTKSARCPCRRRPNCCASWKIPRCGGWAARPNSKWTCGWWRPPTKCPRKRSAAAICARTCIYRLNVFHVHLPPLRERKEDIQPLAEALMADLEPQTRMPRDGHLAGRCWRPSSGTTGRATCANCATCWSAR